MALVVTLAKVAVGFARSRGLLGEGDAAPGEAELEKARVLLARAKEGREKAQQLATDLQDGKGRERLRELVVKSAEKRGFTRDKQEQTTTSDETAAVTAETATASEAELGVDLMMTTLSGAAAESGQSVNDLLDAFNSSKPPVSEVDQTADLMLRAMLMAAKSDGEIDSDEKAAILEALGPDTDAEERALVEELLLAPVDVAALAAATPQGQAIQVYSSALVTIRLDAPPEIIFLDRLARALELDEAVVNALHVHTGRKRLYRVE